MSKAFKFNKTLMAVVLASSSTMLLVPTVSQAGVSANVGMVSNYVFRGVEQKSAASGAGSASAFAGLDYENDSGLYVGTWVADVEDGLEYDFYAGWSGDVKGISLGLGGTYYGYTDATFDRPYKELNLSVGFAGVTLGFDKGVHEQAGSAKDNDYHHGYISYERNNFSATYGMLDPDEDTKKDGWNYLDLGYSMELAKGLDGSINYVYSVPEDSAEDPETYLILGISKSFDLM